MIHSSGSSSIVPPGCRERRYWRFDPAHDQPEVLAAAAKYSQPGWTDGDRRWQRLAGYRLSEGFGFTGNALAIAI